MPAIEKSTPDPFGGRIVRDEGGSPTGIFIDAAQALIYDKVPEPSHDELVRATSAAIAECNRWGLTAVAEPGCNEAVLAAHAELLENDGYSIRNYAMLDNEPSLIGARTRRGIVEAAYNGRLWVRAIKMYADGALGSHGAALLAPYDDEPWNAGLILTPQHTIENVTETALRTGFQACVHAIGDRANRMVLDAFDAALKRVGTQRRSAIAYRARSSDRSARHPSVRQARRHCAMQSTHAVSDMPWAQARLGPQRILDAYAWRSLLDTGAIIANGTDAPVESASTARTFYAAVTHGGRHPEQRMTRREALASMTIWAARANFQEHLVGSIAPGKFADFVVMDRDWMTAAPEDVLQTKIVGTYFGGRRVYP